MSTSFHLRVRQILEQALQQEPDAQEEYIQRACAGNRRLREEATSLLPHYQRLHDFEPARPRAAVWRCADSASFTRACRQAGPAPVADALPALPFTTGDYTLLEILGRGGMGVVYRAVNRATGRQVAIKLLRGELACENERRRFALETQILRQLHHPGIAHILHTGLARLAHVRGVETVCQRRPYIVMEYVSGLPLLEFCCANRLGLRQRLSLLALICEAVAYAHRRGIVHCDLKPANILVNAAGQPKILDFGIAYVVGLPDHQQGLLAGTLAYASPEQLAGQGGRLTPASDVYSLGLVGHELLTGRLPPRDASTVTLKLDGLQVEDKALRDGLQAELRRSLATVLQTALRRSQSGRYRTAAELAADVEALLASFFARSLWSRFRAALAGRLPSRAAPAPDAVGRPLSAVLRQRMALAAESDEHRARPPG